MPESFDADIFVIGGGINGVGIARDAAGRGFSVTLCEQNDLASGTSSASTKLVHGGLRYLEHYEFKLVRAALSEREVLMASAPHIISPLRFVLPHSPGVRPGWLIRLGLFLYDHLGKREKLPGSGNIKLTESDVGASLNPNLRTASCYSDCWVDDSRLVVLNAQDAASCGAKILTRTTCTSACVRENDRGWRVRVRDTATGAERELSAKVIVNAAGPWAESCLSGVVQDARVTSMRLVRGSHIVVPKMFGHDSAYIFQNPDRRIVFAIPYEGDYTMIGTTDEDFSGDLGNVSPSHKEIDYLCATANRFFKRQISSEDIVWQFAGVRPLLADGAGSAKEVTRDYRLDVQNVGRGAVLLSVLGGKITTYRKLAEQAVDQLVQLCGREEGPWTATASLPGGDIPAGDLDAFTEEKKRAYEWLPSSVVERYARSYGSEIDKVIGPAESVDDMGIDFGSGLYEHEVQYLIDFEWAANAEDILWRRTKLGVAGGEALVQNLSDWFDSGASAPGISVSASGAGV